MPVSSAQPAHSGSRKSRAPPAPPPTPPAPPSKPRHTKAKPAKSQKNTQHKVNHRTDNKTDNMDIDNNSESKEEECVHKRFHKRGTPKERPFDKLCLALRLFQPKANQKQLAKAAKMHGNNKAPEMWVFLAGNHCWQTFFQIVCASDSALFIFLWGTGSGNGNWGTSLKVSVELFSIYLTFSRFVKVSMQRMQQIQKNSEVMCYIFAWRIWTLLPLHIMPMPTVDSRTHSLVVLFALGPGLKSTIRIQLRMWCFDVVLIFIKCRFCKKVKWGEFKPKSNEMPTVFHPDDDEDWDPDYPEWGLFRSLQFVQVSQLISARPDVRKTCSAVTIFCLEMDFLQEAVNQPSQLRRSVTSRR